MAPPIATITAHWALGMALCLLFICVTLCDLPCPTCDSGALSTSIVTRDAPLVVPVCESLGRARNQTFNFSLLIVWPTKFEKRIFATETVILLITFSAANWTVFFVAL